jgi:drug/metabolite transporter (DMT)-like permease
LSLAIKIDRRRRLGADGALLCLAFLWGATFIPVKAAVSAFPVLAFFGLRFFCGLLALLPFGLYRLRRVGMRPVQVAQAVLTGWVFLAGYAFQTYGLRATASGRTAFITGLSTIMVPLFLAVFLRERLGIRPVCGAVLATVGMGLLGFDGAASGVWQGDLLVCGGAVAFAWHVIATGKWGAATDPILFTLVQIAGVVPTALGLSLLVEGAVPAIPPATMGAALFTGVVVTGLGLLVQVWAQRLTSPTHTAVIFATEPVFGALFGWLLAGEVLTALALCGCLLILAGMLIAESSPERHAGVG